MTEETFNKVVELNDKLTQMETVREEIGKCTKLAYITQKGSTFPGFNEYPYLTQILRSHEIAVMEEISAEIKEIKQQISRL